jgi:excisionase family DNA binding protein
MSHPSATGMPTPVKPQVYTEAEAAAYLGVKPGTLSVWRSTRRYDLPYLKVGRLVRYDKADLDRWLQSRRVDS